MQQQSECSAGRPMCRGLTLGEFFALCIRTIYMGCPHHRGPTSSETDRREDSSVMNQSGGGGGVWQVQCSEDFFFTPSANCKSTPMYSSMAGGGGGGLPHGYMGGGGGALPRQSGASESGRSHNNMEAKNSYIHTLSFFSLFRVSVGMTRQLSVSC